MIICKSFNKLKLEIRKNRIIEINHNITNYFTNYSLSIKKDIKYKLFTKSVFDDKACIFFKKFNVYSKDINIIKFGNYCEVFEFINKINDKKIIIWSKYIKPYSQYINSKKHKKNMISTSFTYKYRGLRIIMYPQFILKN